MGCDRVAVASPTGFGLGLCTCVLLSVQKEREEREEREGFFPDVTLSLEAQEQATCAARPGAVSVRVKVSSSTMVVGRVQEDRGPLS